jgi:phage-related minor tail protein
MAGKAATVEIQIKADAADALKDVGKAETALQGLEQAAKQTGQGAAGIDELSQAVADLQQTTQEAADSGGGLSEAFAGGLAGGAIVGAIGALGTMVTSAFSKLAELGMDAFAGAMEFDVGRDKLQAQLGLTAEQSKKMGQLAGDLYSEAYGESIGQVNDALKLVTQNIGLNADTQAAELESVTGSVLDLASAFEQDLGGVTRAVGQMIKTGLAANAEEALDILTVGFQKGNDKAEDLLDTMNEYGTTFRTVGITGKVAMGLISQGLQAGARDADIVADAIKEFGIRSKDASKTSADAFKLMGLDAEKMTAIFAKGGEEAAGGLDLVLDSLRNMTDPVERNAAAVGIFGTQAEDLGDALYALDPSSAVAALGDVTGAAKEMGTELADNSASKFEAFKRSIQTNVVTFIADNVLPVFDSMAPSLQKALTRLGQIWDAFRMGFTGQAPSAEDVLGGSISAIENMPTPPEPEMDSTLRQIQDFGKEVRSLADEWIPRLEAALAGLQDALKTTTQFFEDNKDAMETLKTVGIVALAVALVVLIGILVIVGATIGATAIAILGLLSPIITVVGIARYFGVTWEDVWNTAAYVVRNIVQQIQDIIGGIAQFIHGIIRIIDGLMDNDWGEVWEGAKDTVAGAFQAMTAPVQAFMRLIRDLLGLLESATGWDLPDWMTPGSVAVPTPGPTVRAVGASSSSVRGLAMGGTSTVINVSVSHSGLGVDSPRLQRDIVEALRRYDQRNGSRYATS